MRIEEARTIARWIEELNLPSGSVCLNVGSSTAAFRRDVQPHIQKELFAPIERAGLRVVHCDLKEAEGVDEVGDLLDADYRKHLQTYDAHIMICSNLLEHLSDPTSFVLGCGELVRADGYGIFTIPYSYPYHPDPIDTMLRLNPNELASMLKHWKVVRSEVIQGGNHWRDLKHSGEPFRRLFRQTVRVLLPFYRPSQWKHIVHRMLWLSRPFTSSAVLLNKPN